MVSGAVSTSLLLGLLPLAGEPAPPDRPKVAIMFLEDRTGDQALAHWCKTTHRILFEALRNAPSIHVLERQASRYASFRLSLKLGSAIGGEKAREAGEVLGVDRVVCGELPTWTALEPLRRQFPAHQPLCVRLRQGS